MNITDSKERISTKRLPILREKYGKDFGIFFGNDSGTCLSVRKRKAKWLEHNALAIYVSYINVYRRDCLELAKEIAKMFDIEEIIICYTDDLE